MLTRTKPHERVARLTERPTYHGSLDAHQIGLLREAQRVLDGERPADDASRRELATRLERLRYEQLRRGVPSEDAAARAWLDALDLAAGALANRPERQPRALQAALASRRCAPADRFAECLDRRRSVADLEQRAADLTARHFTHPVNGRRRVLLYAPLYLSSHCVNYCEYCGFRYPNAMARRHLTHDEALEQVELLRRERLRHVLLVGGDFPALTTVEYYARVIASLVERGVEVPVEIAPQSTAAYEVLAAAGACGVTLYQETYDRGLYARYHPRGTKIDYDWRLEGLERAAEAGLRRLGLGVLLGLADPRADLPAMIRHAEYLRERFPQSTIAVSLPRIHEAPQSFQGPYPVDDETLVRLYCALRIAMPEVELVLSTREAPALRNRLAGSCITQLSAGSSTVPGGYRAEGAQHGGGEQFPVSDHRTPAEVAAWLDGAGVAVRWNHA